MKPDAPDAIVVGSGPNGLAAAITLARAGRSVVVYEAHPTVGGGMRSAELTLPGFVHDICSTVQGTSTASPFFRDLDLGRLGLEFIDPPAPLAHPLDGGRAAILERSVADTAAGLGGDRAAYRRLMGPLVRDADAVMDLVLGPIFRVPRHPLAAARFGLPALRSAVGLARGRFSGEEARALLAGVSAHSMLRLERPLTASFGLVLGITAHAYGWPIVRGGTQQLADALATELRSLGGEIVTDHPVTAISELPAARAVLFDTTPRALAAIAGDRLPGRYRRRLEGFRYGPGVVKVDWALERPDPLAGGGGFAGPARSMSAGRSTRSAPPKRRSRQGATRSGPFVLVVQQSRFDASRAPAGRHTGWAYCHVPSGSTFDMSDRIEAQVERFAPGFRDTILARSVRLPADMEAYNPNYVGGDINAGIEDLRQLFTRPVGRLDPYSTADPRDLPLLVVDPAGRRRPRHVRRLGGPVRAQSGIRQRRLTGEPVRSASSDIASAGAASYSRGRSCSRSAMDRRPGDERAPEPDMRAREARDKQPRGDSPATPNPHLPLGHLDLAARTDSVLALQRTAGNRATVRRLQRLRRKVAVARITDEALGSRAATDAVPAPAGSGDAALVRVAVASGDVGDIKAIDNFSSATEAERLVFLDHLAHQTWAGPRDEAAMVRIWNSFGNGLLAVADSPAHRQLWADCVDKGMDVGDITALSRVRDTFQTDVKALARTYMEQNRTFAESEMERFGIRAPQGAVSPTQATESDLHLEETQDLANLAKGFLDTKARMLTVMVGYDMVMDPRAGGLRTPVTFDPDPAKRPTFTDGSTIQNQAPPRHTWDEMKRGWDDADAALAAITAQNPTVYAALAQGGDAVTTLATGTPEQARATAGQVLTTLHTNIEATLPRLDSGELDWRDLKPIHDQLYGGRTTPPPGRTGQAPCRRAWPRE